MENITKGQDLLESSSNFIELSEIINRQIENLLLFPLARLGNLRQSDLEAMEQVEKAIQLIALEADAFEKWKSGHLLEDSAN